MEVEKLVSVVLCALSLLPLLIVFIKSRSQKEFMKKAINTTAEVTHCEKRLGFRGAVYYILSLQYQITDGSQVLTGKVGSKKKEKGDHIPLLYLQDDPATFSIDFGKKTPLAMVLTFLFFVAIVALCTWLNLEVQGR